jgi:hypothetical protein
MGKIDASNDKIKGVFIEAGGDIIHDGVIETSGNAVVGMKAQGNYSSTGGQIIQKSAAPDTNVSWQKWQTLLAVVAIVVAVVIAVIGWMYFS